MHSQVVLETFLAQCLFLLHKRNPIRYNCNGRRCEDMSLGSRLRERRQQLGLTLEEVAQTVGVSKSTVQKWESGTIEDMRLAKAAGLAKVLKVSPLWIMGISESMTDPTPKAKTKRVPVLGCIAAGDPIVANEEYGEYIELSSGPDVDFCLRVRGDSMIDARICD